METIRLYTARSPCAAWPTRPVFLPLLLLALLRLRGAATASKDMTCEPITVPMCRDVGYNLTYMPNQFNHYTQDEVGLEVHQFWPLVRIQCSPDLLFFLCSMYTPICIADYRQPLPPCRAVCQRAKRGCSPLMSQYGFEWPEKMSCQRLPELSDPVRLCMDRNASEAATTPSPPPTAKPSSRGPPRAPPRRRPPPPPPALGPRDCDPECRRRPCRQPHFTAGQHAFTGLWLGLWAGLCFLSTAATLATFLIDRERFKYPELPIVYLAACSLCVAAGYLVRLAAGHERVACAGQHAHAALSDPSGGTAPLCTLVFLLLYFFGMAGSIWWVLLSFTWFLAAGLKWSSEAIAGYAHYYHLAAWLLPTAQTAAALALGAVDGDPAVGVCYVGSGGGVAGLRVLVLAPLVVYLLAGCAFLLAGFVSLFRIRSVVKRGGTKTDKLERLMVRLGLFTVLYVVPAVAVVTCLAYEQHLRPRPCACPRPDHAVFMLKHFMTLVVGVTSGVWVWSGKTLEAWNALLARCCCRVLRGGPSGGSTYSEASSSLTHRTAATPSHPSM